MSKCRRHPYVKKSCAPMNFSIARRKKPDLNFAIGCSDIGRACLETRTYSSLFCTNLRSIVAPHARNGHDQFDPGESKPDKGPFGNALRHGFLSRPFYEPNAWGITPAGRYTTERTPKFTRQAACPWIAPAMLPAEFVSDQ